MLVQNIVDLPAPKGVRLYKDCYMPSGMSEGNFDIIETLRMRGARVQALKNIIYNFPLDFLMEALSSGLTVFDYCKEQGIDPLETFPGELYDTQTAGVGFLYMSKRSVLGDKPGAGKTVMISALLNLLRQRGELKRFVFFAQPSSRVQILFELMRFTGMNIMMLDSNKPKLEKAFKNGLSGFEGIDGIIFNHSALRSDTLQLELTKLLDDGGLYDTVIIDESHVLKNAESKTFQYATNIVNLAQRVHLMNATVFERNILDIYNHLKIIDPQAVPKESYINKNFCKYSPVSFYKKINGVARRVERNQLAGYKNQEIFKNYLRAHYFGRSYEELGYQENQEYRVDYVYKSKEQAKALSDGHNYLLALNDIRPVYLGLADDVDMITKPVLNRLPKVERLVELITGEYQGMKVVIYCWYIEAQHKIKRFLEFADKSLQVGILNGETAVEEQERLKSSFNNPDGGLSVLITNAQNALNLNGGQVAIIYTPLFTSAKTEQFVARINRDKGATRKIFHLLLYRDTEEFNFFKGIVVQRSKDGSDLIQEDVTPVDRFNKIIDEMEKAIKMDGTLKNKALASYK